jgi:hypothetical protein
MPNSEHFFRRADFYRRQAAGSPLNAKCAEESLWLANLFARMGHDVYISELAKAQARQPSTSTGRARWWTDQHLGLFRKRLDQRNTASGRLSAREDGS